MTMVRIARRAGAVLAVASLTWLPAACSPFEISTIGGADQTSGTGGGETGRLTEASMARSWERGLQLLAEGDEEMAEAEFVLARESPEYRERARTMLRQIRTAPTRYFPSEYFHVALSRGQSLSSLAERYLGNALEFYALARYNAIRTPADVAVGQQIRIPLTEQAARVRRAETGSPDTDDPITEPEGGVAAGEAGAAEPAAGAPAEASAGGDEAAADAPGAGEAGRSRRREIIARHYREATQAFQQQDLEATIRHCEKVLELDPDHANCQLYRARARELKRRLEDIPASG